MFEGTVAVTSRSFSNNATLRAELESRYQKVTFNTQGLRFQHESLIDFLRGHDKAIIGLERLTAEVFDAVPELRVISKYGVGFDALDIKAMSQRGIRLGWQGGVNKRSVSELVIAQAIVLLRRAYEANKELCSGLWRQHTGEYLSKKTVGILGCGNVGQDLVKLLTVFECRILAFDIVNYKEFYSKYGVRPVELPELLAEADIVSVHLPLNSSTKDILDAKHLNMMKTGGILINFARGGLVDENELRRLLIRGKIRGAAFDVFGKEPPKDEQLLNLPNFIATPHIGGSSKEAILAMGRAAIEGLEKADFPLDEVAT